MQRCSRRHRSLPRRSRSSREAFTSASKAALNWIFNSSFNSTFTIRRSAAARSRTRTLTWNTGYVLGGALGYDFVGPRIEVEGAYRANNGTLAVGGVVGSAGINFQQINVMGNVYYDFLAGCGDRSLHRRRRRCRVPQRGRSRPDAANSTQFAYQAMVGVGCNIDQTFRLNLEGRYMGTTTPNFTHQGSLRAAPASR